MHKVYKLLRNNQQTGPYSLEELAALHLKAFDLIWEEGRSAGWSYPSEIDSLKPYGAEAPSSVTPGSKDAPEASGRPQESPPERLYQPMLSSVATQPVLSAKHIFVRLPAGATRVSPDPAKQDGGVMDVEYNPAPGEETPEQKLERKALELRQRVQALALEKKRAEEEPTLDTKYARSLDDIKEEYTHWMRGQKSKRPRLALSVPHLVRAAAVLVVAIAGLAGAVWLVDYLKAPATAASRQTQVPGPAPGRDTEKAAREEEPTPSQTVFEASTVQLKELENANELIAEDLRRLSATKAKPAVPHKGEEDYSREATEDPVTKHSDVIQGDRWEPPTRQADAGQVSSGERQASKRREHGGTSLAQQIDVRAKYLPSGRRRGVSGLALTVHNNSGEVLKFVAVDVFYYRDGEQLVARETLYFNNLHPQDVLTLQAPGHKKASTARYQLGLISSGEGALYVVR